MTQVETYTPRAQQAVLKDGRSALVRAVSDADAADLLAMDHAVHADGRGTVLSPDELPPDVEAQRKRLADRPTGTNGTQIVLELDGAVVGLAGIRRQKLRRLHHVAGVDIGVHPNAQALGAGRILMLALLEWARDVPGDPITRIELYVLANNDRAIALYHSLGFEIEGTRRNFARDLAGDAYIDDLTMALLLD